MGRGFGGAEGEGQGGGAVGMTIGGVGGAVMDLSVGGDDALDRVEVFADGGGAGDGEEVAFERGTEMGKEFVLEGRGEGAEFDFAGAIGSGVRSGSALVFAVSLDEEVAEADACAGVIEADAAGAMDARGEVFELVGSGAVGEH